MKKNLLAGLILSVIFTINSYAQEVISIVKKTVVPEQSAEEMVKNMTIKDAEDKFVLIDKNGDDKITRNEYINFSLREQAAKKLTENLETTHCIMRIFILQCLMNLMLLIKELLAV